MAIEIDDDLIKLLGGAPRRPYDAPPVSTYRTGKDHYGKTFENPFQASPQANAFATALLSVVAAKVALEAAEHSTYSRDTGDEQDAYQRAVQELWTTVGGR